MRKLIWKRKRENKGKERIDPLWRRGGGTLNSWSRASFFWPGSRIARLIVWPRCGCTNVASSSSNPGSTGHAKPAMCHRSMVGEGVAVRSKRLSNGFPPPHPPTLAVAALSHGSGGLGCSHSSIFIHLGRCNNFPFFFSLTLSSRPDPQQQPSSHGTYHNPAQDPRESRAYHNERNKPCTRPLLSPLSSAASDSCP